MSSSALSSLKCVLQTVIERATPSGLARIIIKPGDRVDVRLTDKIQFGRASASLELAPQPSVNGAQVLSLFVRLPATLWRTFQRKLGFLFC